MHSSIIASIRKTVFIKPHPAGTPFILGAAVVTVVLAALSAWLGLIGLILTLFCLYFFRNPERVTPQKDSLVIAPGDGVVSAVVRNVSMPAEIGESQPPCTRVSIFLSVLDVHVNRIPVSGRIIRKVYKPGKFLNADLDKASEDNERCSALIETTDGRTIGLVQIAGLVARRIVNDLKDGDTVTAGARFEIIRFGSRVDVYIPGFASVQVCVGQRAVGGETVLADLTSGESDRKGAVQP